MRYIYIPCALHDIGAHMAAYVATLNGPVDDYWEEHILRGDAYSLRPGGDPAGDPAGFFTLFQGEDGRYITSFYLPPAHWGAAEEVFADILKTFAVERALVATCDELFLSLVMDKQTKVDLQAYYFLDTPGANVPPPQFSADCMRRVQGAELPRVHSLTEGFFMNDCTPDSLDAGEQILWELREGDEPLGFGIIVFNKLATRYAPCGEYVLERHRRRGVARSLQYHMADYLRARGLIPAGGCWYYNTASRNTFYSIGRYSKTRLLNVAF